MIVLDTHIWLWWINQDSKLKATWLEHIGQAVHVGVSAISLFEVSWLERHGRIQFSEPYDEWFDKALAGSDVRVVPITPKIAWKAATLPEHHSDPQDRIIIATALIHNARLLSADSKFRLYAELDDLLIQ